MLCLSPCSVNLCVFDHVKQDMRMMRSTEQRHRVHHVLVLTQGRILSTFDDMKAVLQYAVHRGAFMCHYNAAPQLIHI